MIFQKANFILNKYWDRNIPVNVEDIALKIGFDIFYTTENINPSDESISAKLYVLQNNKPVSFIRQFDSPIRKRFTLAHQIGHYILSHGCELEENSATFNIKNVVEIEYQANLFALYLLIPELALNYAFDKTKLNSAEELSALFETSLASVNERLKLANI